MDYDCEKTTLLNSNDEFEKGYTLNDCIETLGFGLFQIKLFCVVGLSWMADAIAITLLGVLGPSVQCYWNLTEAETALISTCVFIGMFFGAWFWGWLCDYLGRKLAITCSMITVGLFGILNALAPSYKFLLAFMILQGFGVGGVGQSMTIFSEFLPAHARAAGLIFINLFYVAGNLCSAIIALITMSPLGWRWFIICSIVPILIFIIISWWLPESPRYLVTAGKEERADEILSRVAKDNRKEKPPGKLQKIDCHLRKPRGRFIDLLNKEYRKTTLILWCLWFSSIFSYYGIILCTAILLNHEGDSCGSGKVDKSNIPSVITPSNMHGNTTVHVTNHCHTMSFNDYIGYLLTALGEVPGLVLTFLLAERLGRKPTMALLFAASVITISFLHMCMKKVALVTIIFLLRAFMTGLVQSVYLYTPEVYPTNIRATGFGTASAMARLGAILTPFVSQVLIQTSPHLAVFLYTGVMTVCIAGSLMLPKETKGLKLIDIDETMVAEETKK